jgi:hypothetical protein
MTEAQRFKNTGGGRDTGTAHHPSRTSSPPAIRRRPSAERWKLNLKNCVLFWSFTHTRTLQPGAGASIRYVARFGLRVLFHFVQRPRQK